MSQPLEAVTTDQLLLAQKDMQMYAKKTEQSIERLIAEGRGQGEGRDYKGFVTVHDFSSRGRCHRIYSHRWERTFQLFSDIEKSGFLLCEWQRSVLDLREQWPILDRTVSAAVARSLGIKHPVYPGTNVPMVLTVDFLAKIEKPTGTAMIGIDTKPRQEAENPRAIEKLQLTRACLAHYGYGHVLLFDDALPKTMIRNIEWIRSARPHPDEMLPYPDALEETTERLLGLFSSRPFGKTLLRAVCAEFDHRIGQPPGTGLRAARLLMDRRILLADLNCADLHQLPMNAFRLAVPASSVRMAVSQ
jgi:hypothetical protein